VGLPSTNSGGPNPSCFVLSSASLLYTTLMRDTALHVAPRPLACRRVTLHRQLPQQTVGGPGEILDFGDEFRPDPVDAAQHKGRSDAAVTRRRHRERHLGGREGMQLAPQSRQLRLLDVGAGAAGIDKASVGIIGASSRAPRYGRFPSGSVQPTTTNSSRCRHLTLSHRPRLPGRKEHRRISK